MSEEENRTITVNVDEYGKVVHRLMMDRYANHVLRSECDFLSGAAAVLQPVSPHAREWWCPSNWVLGPMGGRPAYGCEQGDECFGEDGKLIKVTQAMYDDAHKPLKGRRDDIATLKAAVTGFISTASDEDIELYLGLSRKEADEEVTRIWEEIS